MAKTVTLLNLRTQAQQRSNMENSGFITTAEWNTMINSSCDELYDLLIAAYVEYFLSTSTISVLSGTDTYPLPADFYKLVGVDLVLDSNGNAVSLKPFQFGERNSFLFTPTWNTVGASYLRYHLQGANVRFVPIPNTAQTVKLWYAPARANLVLDADTFDGVDGWEEYAVLDVAIKALLKEESDASALMIQKEAMRKRIEQLVNDRDIGAPSRVTDIHRNLPYEFWAFGEH